MERKTKKVVVNFSPEEGEEIEKIAKRLALNSPAQLLKALYREPRIYGELVEKIREEISKGGQK